MVWHLLKLIVNFVNKHEEREWESLISFPFLMLFVGGENKTLQKKSVPHHKAVGPWRESPLNTATLEMTDTIDW